MGDHPHSSAENVRESSASARDPSDQAHSGTQLVSAPEEAQPSSRATPRAHVLVVDDDPEARRSLSRQLRNLGYYVDVAQSGVEAVDYIDQTSYDVVVSDIKMPGMDGIQLLREVRRHDLHVPVVLLTGAPAVSTAAQAVQYGAFHYLTKPAPPQEFEKVLDRATGLRRMARLQSEATQLVGGFGPLGIDRAGLETSFESCLDQLWMAYHPIVDARAQRVFGYEALLRSREPSLPHPAAVFDAAERLERLDELGRAIRRLSALAFREAVAQEALFVNLHVTDLADPTLLDPGSPLCQMADRVVLEITERSSLDEVKDARRSVVELREIGFRIAIDDMGSGYAGLTSFALLEPEFVKLDMSLTREVHLNPTKQKVIRSMTDLCRDMGMNVVAEGVETVDERDTLLEIGCDLLQGFLFAKPGKPFPKVSW